jgi:hypothetical protein
LGVRPNMSNILNSRSVNSSCEPEDISILKKQQ